MLTRVDLLFKPTHKEGLRSYGLGFGLEVWVAYSVQRAPEPSSRYLPY